MGGALLSFSLMAVSVRELLHSMGNFEILALRSLRLASPRACGPAAPRPRQAAHRRFGLHVLRNVLHLGGQYAWVYAIAMLPLATVFAIEFTMPVWTAILAALILGERLNRGRHRHARARPRRRPHHIEARLCTGASGGARDARRIVRLRSMNVATKRLSESDSALAVVFYMAAIQLPLALVPALPNGSHRS